MTTWGRLGFVDWRAWDGNNYKDMAAIDVSGETSSPSDRGTALMKLRVANGSNIADLMALDSNSNVGVGTNAPLYDLDLHLSNDVPNNVNPGPYGGLNLQQAGASDNWTFFPVGGFFFIYHNNDPIGFFDAADGSWNPGSDMRLKEEIKPIAGNQLSKLLQLKPKTYYMKHNENRTKRAVGFIAQEVQKNYPDLVSQPSIGEQEMLAMNYTGLIPYLVKGDSGIGATK